MSEILKITFVVDNTELINKEILDYEFSTFGIHEIKMIAYRNDGAISESSFSLNFQPEYLPPAPSFSYYIEAGRRLILNASDSLGQGRKVASYKWDFSDGSSETTSHYLYSRTFQNYQSYQVKLTVVDENGASQNITKNIYVYDPEVIDPLEENDLNELGIDSDNNKVRDDIQRWINFVAEDNLQLKSSLKELAINWQELIENKNSPSVIKEKFKKHQKLKIYLYGVLDNDLKANSLYAVMKFLVFRSEVRLDAYTRINTALIGEIIMSIPESKEERLNVLGSM